MSIIKPKMFSGSKSLDSNAQELTNLKNISTKMSSYFYKAKIETKAEFLKLGWIASWEKLIKSDSKCLGPYFGHALMAAYLNVHRLELTHKQKNEVKQIGQQLRKKYRKISKK